MWGQAPQRTFKPPLNIIQLIRLASDYYYGVLSVLDYNNNNYY